MTKDSEEYVSNCLMSFTCCRYVERIFKMKLYTTITKHTNSLFATMQPSFILSGAYIYFKREKDLEK